MPKKLFIFDLDGVLVDACNWHRDALNEALHEICNYTISLQDHISVFNGIPTKKKLEILSNRGVVPIEKHHEINVLKQNKTIKIIEQRAFVREEKIQMIKEIREKGHIVCCYTNSIRKTANLMLEKTGIKKLFHEVLTNQDVRNPKPDPEGYLFLMNKYGYDGSKTYIIEDSPKGIEAASKSNANVIEVKNTEQVNSSLIRRYL
jgi:HAD superfamily hydrolase (TIGR01509 family)